jgi:hypothetical protein
MRLEKSPVTGVLPDAVVEAEVEVDDVVSELFAF